MSTDRLVAKLTVRDIDLRLLAMHDAFCTAMRDGDLTSADAAYEAMDELLDQRIHIPVQP